MEAFDPFRLDEVAVGYGEPSFGSLRLSATDCDALDHAILASVTATEDIFPVFPPTAPVEDPSFELTGSVVSSSDSVHLGSPLFGTLDLTPFDEWMRYPFSEPTTSIPSSPPSSDSIAVLGSGPPTPTPTPTPTHCNIGIFTTGSARTPPLASPQPTVDPLSLRRLPASCGSAVEADVPSAPRLHPVDLPFNSEAENPSAGSDDPTGEPLCEEGLTSLFRPSSLCRLHTLDEHELVTGAPTPIGAGEGLADLALDLDDAAQGPTVGREEREASVPFAISEPGSSPRPEPVHGSEYLEQVSICQPSLESPARNDPPSIPLAPQAPATPLFAAVLRRNVRWVRGGGDKIDMCPECGHPLSKKHRVSDHAKARRRAAMVVQDARPYKCEQAGCVKDYKRLGDLVRHEHLVHNFYRPAAPLVPAPLPVPVVGSGDVKVPGPPKRKPDDRKGRGKGGWEEGREARKWMRTANGLRNVH